ncbi:MAG TPA: LuxR C-terminal-related transcriptional regulator [Ktedonobacteraceae bacterium]|nr:LuxR C-terminal-related transcriptional regulator [Ktedonobacteraceae bacterium]
MRHRRSRQKPLSDSLPDDPSFRSNSHVFSGEEIDYRELFLRANHLLNRIQTSRSSTIKSVIQEIACLLSDQARIIWMPLRPEPGAYFLPIEFNGYGYGYLVLTDSLVLDMGVAVALARYCGLILYTLEVTTYFQSHYPLTPYRLTRNLKKREREVLAFMCQNYTPEAIAEKLHLSLRTVHKYRESIYNALGVHSLHEVFLRLLYYDSIHPSRIWTRK